MEEQFLGGFRLNRNNNFLNNNKSVNDKVKQKEEKANKIFNFNAEDKFTASFRKNEVESTYALLNRYEKDSLEAKKLEKEIAQIKALEAKTKDYFNF